MLTIHRTAGFFSDVQYEAMGRSLVGFAPACEPGQRGLKGTVVLEVQNVCSYPLQFVGRTQHQLDCIRHICSTCIDCYSIASTQECMAATSVLSMTCVRSCRACSVPGELEAVCILATCLRMCAGMCRQGRIANAHTHALANCLVSKAALGDSGPASAQLCHNMRQSQYKLPACHGMQAYVSISAPTPVFWSSACLRHATAA